MIRVSKIAHAAYETPDLAQQTEYYTDIIGLSLVAQEKDTVYLASTVDHHSIVLRKGAPAQCTRVGLQIPDAADLDAFESQVKGRGIVTERRKDPEPSIKDMLVFADPKGTVMEVFKREAFSHQKFQSTGIVPYKLGHVAFHVTDVKHVTKFYCDVLGFRESDWMADFFSFLRCGPDHHTIKPDRTGTSTPPSSCATGRICKRLAIFSVCAATSCYGDRGGTASATICSLITARRTG
jgi:catechol 2,3-dioxygenase-like lactoylglutathione lyase family enzyme